MKLNALCSNPPNPPLSKGGEGGLLLYVPCFLLIALLMILPSSLQAGVTGNCSNCHTMHNSQNGSNMQIGYGSTPDAKANLLRANGCLGCHAATDSSSWTGVGGAPIVYNTTGVTYGDGPIGARVGLAAGNFYWLTAASGATSTLSRGHSIGVIPYADDPNNHSYDPRGSCGTNCHGQLSDKGCETCHVPAHHKGNSSGGWADATNGYYRFLGPNPDSDSHQWGVRGYEDPDWQKTYGSGDHNEYSGEAATTGYHSISTHCLGCHDAGSYPDLCASDTWYHEADTVLLDPIVDTRWDGYRYYETGSTMPGLYSPMLPIARLYITNYTSPSKVVHTPLSGGTDTLTCLTCHRAHASPYDKMLRWDNGSLCTPPGGGTCENCESCHK
jgi:predicted CXXCH cytochrome family protein